MSWTSKIGRGLRGLWWLLDGTRRAIVNLLLLLLLVLLLWALLRGGPPPLQDKTVLVLQLSGGITEQRSGTSRGALLRRVQGDEVAQTRLRDVLAVLDAAAADPQIRQALLLTDDFVGAGLPTLREVAAAINRFKAAGKPVVAWGSRYSQAQYFLAAHATEVWMHPMGRVGLEGYGRYRNYYRDLLDKVGVTAHVIRAGKFKSANENLVANGPSPETQQADGQLYGSLWASYTGAVEKARKRPAGSLQQTIESLPDSLVALGGDEAQWALKQGYVDALKTRDEMRAALMDRGAVDPDIKSFRQVSAGNYLARVKPKTGNDIVGVIVAEGGIGEGRAGPGEVGGLSTSELVRQARENPQVKAVVLRVNSPGGSPFGSELIRHELELTRKAGKPVVVSMGDLAASGGYWISLAADEMMADEATITGSIGVVAMLPTAQAALDKLGVHTAGAPTTWLAGAYDPRRDLDPRFEKLVQTGVDRTYTEFKALAATARKTTPEKIDEVAQGRVWSGKDALARGLVDRLGSIGDAQKSAATRAKLQPGWRVEYLEAPPGRLQMLLQRLGVQADVQAWLSPSTTLQGLLVGTGLLPPMAAEMADELSWLGDIRERHSPFAAMVHCLCKVP